MRFFYFLAKLFFIALFSAACSGPNYLGTYTQGNSGSITLRENQSCTVATKTAASECFYEIRENILYITLDNGAKLRPMPFEPKDSCFYLYCREANSGHK